MTIDPIWFTAAALVLAGWLFGLWRGERIARRYIENMQTYGTPEPLKKAVVTHPYTAEDAIEEVIDEATGRRTLRLVRQDDSQPAWDEQTVQNGVEWLLDEARSRGEQLSTDDAREEVMRMLNAEGSEMA